MESWFTEIKLPKVKRSEEQVEAAEMRRQAAAEKPIQKKEVEKQEDSPEGRCSAFSPEDLSSDSRLATLVEEHNLHETE